MKIQCCSVLATSWRFCLIPTVLCGGECPRFWPVSREFHPKPFILLADVHSRLQKACLRGAQLLGKRHLMTVINLEPCFKIEDESCEVNATNESTYIPAGHHHRLCNVHATELVTIEVQSGDYLVEDDIVRLEDPCGRVADGQ